MPNSLAVITVVYKNYEILNDLFSSFEKQIDKDFHFFIADLSPDKQTITKPNFAHTIINEKNIGYAGGVNICVEEAMKSGLRQFVIINPDTYVSENFISSVKTSLVNNPNSVIGGKIYYAPQYEYHKDKYQKEDLGKVIWYAGGIIDWDNVYIKHEGVDEIDNPAFSVLKRTNFITGCLMAYNDAVFTKVGKWDESYFLYYEDADFCERAKLKNIKLIYDPSIVMWHKNGQSTEGSGSVLQNKFMNKNRIKFGLKYAPLRTRIHLFKNSFLDLLK